MKSFLLPPFLWLCIAWLAPAWCHAQNLVPNSNFEEYSQCPSDISMFELATGWITPSGGTTDYYNACSSGRVNVPNGAYGYQEARSGKGYGALILFEPTGRNYREYAQIRLKEPLKKGVVYHTEFFVSSILDLGVSNLGAYFSINPPSSSEYSLLDNVIQPPQVRNQLGYLSDKVNWMKVEGKFMADGGEQYLTIGNFEDDTHTRSVGNDLYAYYYIDDVSVWVADCPIVTELGPDVVLCPGASLALDATSKGATYRWQDGSTQPKHTVKSPGTYWVDVRLNNCSFRDSIKVDYLDR